MVIDGSAMTEEDKRQVLLSDASPPSVLDSAAGGGLGLVHSAGAGAGAVDSKAVESRGDLRGGAGEKYKSAHELRQALLKEVRPELRQGGGRQGRLFMVYREYDMDRDA